MSIKQNKNLDKLSVSLLSALYTQNIKLIRLEYYLMQCIREIDMAAKGSAHMHFFQPYNRFSLLEVMYCKTGSIISHRTMPLKKS